MRLHWRNPVTGRRRLWALALVLAACLPAPARAQAPLRYLGPDGALLPLDGPEAVRDFLRTAPVLRIEELSSGTTHPRRLTLEQGQVRARAVFKAVSIEHEALRIRGGSAYAAFYDQATAEIAAYELALLLGIRMIPPTVLREIDGESGAVQLWVEDAMTETERSSKGLTPPDYGEWRRQHQVMSFFDGLVHNQDRNTGNLLIDSTWRLWLIDHTRAFQRPRGRNEFPHVQQLPRSLWEAFLALDDEQIRDHLGPYLDNPQMAALLRRRHDLEAHVRGLIRTRGEGAVLLR